MNRHKFRIQLTAPGRGKVWIDDMPLVGVTSVSVKAAVDCVTEINLSMHAFEVDIEGDVNLDIDVTHLESTERESVTGAHDGH